VVRTVGQIVPASVAVDDNIEAVHSHDNIMNLKLASKLHKGDKSLFIGEQNIMSETIRQFKMGWLPDYPDFRDYTVEQEEVSSRLQQLGQRDSVKAMLAKVGVAVPTKVNLPSSVDLREWCSPVKNQGNLGSGVAHVGVELVEYFERRAFGKHIELSRLFLYKVARNLLQLTGDTGTCLRTIMGALALFGVPPEKYWPYVIADFDKEPPAFCYALAQNYQAIQYYRLDPPETPRDVLLRQIKANLVAGLPSMSGVMLHSSYRQAVTTGKIPYPTPYDRIMGGLAIVAVGYDDTMKIKNTNPGGVETTGALLLRNHWGTNWGDEGYGWLPYDYVLNWLAVDWWSLLKNEWVDTGAFQI
jgi:C1A family cysteine protease